MARLNIEEHVKKLKDKLNVNPTVLLEEKAKEYIKNKNDLKIKINGLYSFEENTVAVVHTRRISTLAHEMRHAYQYKNKEELEFVFEQNNDISFCYKKYYLSDKEKDANKFAVQYCMENHLLIQGVILWICSVLIVNIFVYTGLYKVANLLNS